MIFPPIFQLRLKRKFRNLYLFHVCELASKRYSYLMAQHFDMKNSFHSCVECQHIPITINGKVIPHSNTAKYLGTTLDAKLRWNAHVTKKREELGQK